MKRFSVILLGLLAATQLFAVSPTHSHAPASLGVALHDIMAEETAQFNLPGEYGAWVVAVAPGSAAATSGVQVNDVILAFNGQRVESARTLQRLVSEAPAGRTVELRLVRGGAPILLIVKLGAAGAMAPAPADTPAAATAPAPAPAPVVEPVVVATPRPTRRFGVGVEPLAAAVAEHFGLPAGIGLIVRQVQPDSAAAKAGVQNRDILTKIGESPIRSAEDIGTFINEMPGDSAELTVLRGNDTVTLTVSY